MISMMTWTEAFGEFKEHGFKNTHFPQDWTGVLLGVVAGICSHHRPVYRQDFQLPYHPPNGGRLHLFGSLGCAVFFVILGNYGMYLQLSGELDVISILKSTKAPNAAIFAVLKTPPMAKAVIAVFITLAVIFTATTFDSISYILASVVQHEVDDEPHRWNRLFWAFALCFMPAVLMFIGRVSPSPANGVYLRRCAAAADHEPDYALDHSGGEIRLALPARLLAQYHPY